MSVFVWGCLALSGGRPVLAQEASGPIVAVIHIDVSPDYTTAAAGLLAQLRRDSQHEAGERDFEVLQQIGRPNHFTLVEAWADEKAFDAHNAAPHTRRFRDQLQPMLGSPFDERLHTPLADGGR
ncbi:MAG TPA: putative quinol monooxygenase [Candidatus Methylacidiphilales bacterium]|nr:putative quinol monooxygenase [Candidatus Methylacidiphilales bacterium]